MPHSARIVVAVASALTLLTACSEQAGKSDPAGASAANDDSSPMLTALSSGDIRSAALGGELGCSFAERQGELLLVAMGYVASTTASNGAIKVEGRVEPVHAADGFDGMINGATFTGEGHTVVIAVTGPAEDGGESPPRPADLTYRSADGASRTINGRWVCGP